MDLIDRAALLKDLGEPHTLDYNAIATVCKVKEQPTIEAVPLEPLCEWLSGHAGRPMDCVGHLCGKCEFDGVGVGQEKCWENLIRKWMEEQHDAE